MHLAFPNMTDWRHASDREQRFGVDFVVWGDWVEGVWVHKIDGKFRREIWLDILVEVESNSQSGSSGWAVKRSSETDYLAYCWVPNRETWFIPFSWMQRVMAKQEWVRRFGKVESLNKAHFGNYTTTSIAVPKSVVWTEVPNCYIIDLGRPSADL